MHAVMETIADNCSYHDTIYNEPFVGKQAIKEYFAKVQRILGPRLLFVVDKITDGDSNSVGVKWCAHRPVFLRRYWC
jgi:hypothetical protein